MALRSIVGNVADLTRLRKEALQDDTTWTQPDTAIDKPPGCAQADDSAHHRTDG